LQNAGGSLDDGLTAASTLRFSTLDMHREVTGESSRSAAPSANFRCTRQLAEGKRQSRADHGEVEFKLVIGRNQQPACVLAVLATDHRDWSDANESQQSAPETEKGSAED
jgi:hypothetical protein